MKKVVRAMIWDSFAVSFDIGEGESGDDFQLQ